MDLIIYYIIIAVTIIWLVIVSKNKSKFGVNFKRVYCPVCGAKQPRIRTPQNQQQFLFGGTTCPGCKTELDKYGRIISKDA